MKRVAVFGASGLVGTAVTERLVARDDVEVIPVIHGSGSAWRLARLGLALRSADLLEREQIRDVVAGCTHVVNCTRGTDELMIGGLANLLGECRSAGIEKFVHLSSVAVYGDPPPPESARENAATRPHPGSYGATKLRQDNMVANASRRGLPAVILCPPNITGPFSYFLLQLGSALRSGSLALVDSGQSPCNLVDVANLAYAIDLATQADIGDGSRFFITDDEPVSWADLLGDIGTIFGVSGALPSVGRQDVERRLAQGGKQHSILRSLIHPVSSEVREAMRKDPFWEKVDHFFRGLIARLPKSLEDRIARSVEGPIVVNKISAPWPYDARLLSQQLRRVRHDCSKARNELDYRPIVSYRDSMQAFATWYREVHACEADGFELLAGTEAL